jgi:RNA polymerase sigma-70 factor (ECF subfamily)
MEKRDSSLTNLNDRELVLRAQGGDIGAFETLIFRYDHKVLSMAANYVDNSDDAKDIYQEVLIRVYRALPKFKLKSEFSTWLYRIAANVCLSHRSRSRRHKHLSLDDNAGDEEPHGARTELSVNETPLTESERGDVAEQIEDALQSLSPKQRLVFTLKHYKGLKLSEIAVMMNCSEGTVKKHLFTAIQRLKGKLQHLVE